MLDTFSGSAFGSVVDTIKQLLWQVLGFADTGLLGLTWWQVLLYTLAATHVTIAAVTIYLHRCQAHRAIDVHPIVSHFFRMWLWLTTGMVTRQWSAIHRKHHAKCEQEGDPHSPKVFGLKTVLLQGAELYRKESKNQETTDKYGHGAPDDWMERNVYSKHSTMGIYITLIINLMLFGVLGLTVFAVQMMWIPIFAAGVVNGIGHALGYRNYDAADASTNIVPWGILIGGEELHNNHHAYASSAKFSTKWYEFDAGWMYIKILSAFGLATVKKLAPMPKFAADKGKVDADTLHSVIAYRYDVMATYAKSLREISKEEMKRLAASRQPAHETLAAARSWLTLDTSKWSAQNHAKLEEIYGASSKLKTMLEMRLELAKVWERSSLSKEQLVQHLQEWCVRAEASGMRALEELAQRMRRYAPAPTA
jgi:stearoyl-CoA desaturase (Delta-9 desaturase)